MSGFREECGVFGIWNSESAARLTYLGLYAIQHRGQESAGIVSLFEGRHKQHRGLGLVGEVFGESALESLKGSAAIGHVRYSTSGENLLTNAQPLSASLLNGPIAVAHNGNIANQKALRKKLQKKGAIFQGSNDTEILLHLLAQHPSSDLLEALKDSFQDIEGAYSFVILSHDALIAARDPLGFRPLVLGKKTETSGKVSHVIASETCAFDLIGAQYVREVEPGEILCIDGTGLRSLRISADNAKKALCVFEHVYFARPDSVVFGRSVYESRQNFGKTLAIESPVEADIVVPVPDSGTAAALGYARQSKIPFEMGIIRNHYVGRTFIQPHQSIRDFGVKIKLNPQRALLSGQRVIVVDDSIVRGTTAKKIINLLREAGASEVHMRVAAPPTIKPCYYGVDTPHEDKLIAAQQSVEDIRKFIGADSLGYLSIDGMWKSIAGNENTYCAACFDGKYPTRIEG